MTSAQTAASVFLKAYRSLRQVSDGTWFGAPGATAWPSMLLSQRLEQLGAAHELLPSQLRTRAWVLTSVQRGT